MGVAVVVIALRHLERNLAPRAEASQHSLVHRLQRPGPDEGLVVKARSQHPSHEPVRRLDVEAQRWPRVLRSHLHPCLDTTLACANVWFGAYLDEQVGVEVVRSENSPASVVLEAAAEYPHA